jgi:hypothetical protein
MLAPTPDRARIEANNRPRIVALSAYQYQGVGFTDPSVYAHFHRFRPNDQIGHSILIFDLAQPLPRED